MPSYYSIVRFLPSALAEEFVNVGVLSYSGSKVVARFLQDWQRVEKFADSKDVSRAQDFRSWLTTAMVGFVPSGPVFDESLVRRLAEEWTGSIQLTPPRASLLSPEELLADIAKVFLVEPAAAAPRRNERHLLLERATLSLAGALADRFAESDHIQVRRNLVLWRGLRERRFDLVVTNGAPRYAAQVLNFSNVAEKPRLDKVDAMAFAIEDVRKRFKDLPIGMLVAPPKDPSTAEDFVLQAKATFLEIGDVEVVVADAVEQWATHVADKVAGVVALRPN